MLHFEKYWSRWGAVCLLGLMMLAGTAFAQRTRVSVSEVTGTFEHKFTGKFAGTSSEIKIASKGPGKLRVVMTLIDPYMYGKDPIANTGELDGEATITGDTAIYHSTQLGECSIQIKFVRVGLIKVTQSGSDSDCGFGHNVYADGTYLRTSKQWKKY